MRKPIILISLFILSVTVNTIAQEVDSTITLMRKNIVRYNITPKLLFGGKNYAFGYERVFKNHQSISVNIGVLSFPKLINSDFSKVYLDRSRKNTGYSYSVDYRRYFKKRNRGFAPDGLYWGPYFASYNYKVDNEFRASDNPSTENSSLLAKSSFNVIHTGIQLGYQFVIKKRLTLDLIFIGPGVGFYKAKVNVEGELTLDENQKEFLEEYKDAIIEKFPGLSNAIGDKKFQENGSFKTTSLGYRYVAQIGFLF